MRSAKRLSGLLQQCRPVGKQLEEVVGLGGALAARGRQGGPAGKGLAAGAAIAGNWAVWALLHTCTMPWKACQPPGGAAAAAPGQLPALAAAGPWTATAAACGPSPPKP